MHSKNQKPNVSLKLLKFLSLADWMITHAYLWSIAANMLIKGEFSTGMNEAKESAYVSSNPWNLPL